MMEKMKRIAIALVVSLVIPYFQLFFEANPVHASAADPQPAEASSVHNNVYQEDVDTLYAGLDKYPGYGYTSSIAVFGPDAFAVVLDKGVSPIVGASRHGKGRIIAAGNENYFQLKAGKETAGGKVVSNFLQWLTQDKSPNPVKEYTNEYSKALEGSGKLKLAMKESIYTVEIEKNLPIEKVVLKKWSNLDPLVYPVAFVDVSYVTAEEVDALDQYVKSGGSLIVVKQGWVMSMYPLDEIRNQAKDRNQVRVTDYPVQRLLNRAGLAIVDDFKVAFAPGPKPSLDQINKTNISNLTAPFKQVEDEAKTFMDFAATGEKQPQDVWRRMNAMKLTVFSGWNSIVADDPYKVKVQSEIDAAMDTVIFPLDRLRKPYKSLLIEYNSSVDSLDILGAKFAQSSVFPGQVDSAEPSVEKRISVNMAYGSFDFLRMRAAPGHWVSTGAYAPAGKTVTVNVPADESDLEVQIGSHTDDLTDEFTTTWQRLPKVTLKKRLKPGVNKISSPYGGLVYLIPTKSKPGRKVNVTIGGVVEAPYFVLGETSEQQWKDAVRNHPAPWAELQSEHMILTVPSEDIRLLDNPNELLQKWDDIYSLYTELAGLRSDSTAPNKSPDWPYRIAADKQIVNGFMHAGYPIMLHTGASSKGLLNLNSIQHEGWGYWHEIGHNFQMDSWTWDGNLEVTNNIFALRVQDYLGEAPETNRFYPTAKTHLDKTDVDKDYQSLRDGRLVLFAQLKYAYGWGFYTKLMKAYREIEGSKLPKNSQEVMDQFVIEASKAASENLLAFFDKWGVKYSSKAKDAVTKLNLPMPSVEIWQLGDPAKKQLVPRRQMSATATSEETVEQDNSASLAIDGRTESLWHTQWKNGRPLPHSITLKLGGTYNVSSMCYLPRQWVGTNGNIMDYRILVSSDGENFHEVASGKWENNNKKKTVDFNPVRASYVRLEALAGANGHASAAEIEVYYSLAGIKQ